MRRTFFFPILFLLFTNIHAQLNSAFTTTSGIIVNQLDIGQSYTGVFAGWRQCQLYMSSAYSWTQLDNNIHNIQNQMPGVIPWITIRCTNPVTSYDSIPGTCAYNYTNGNYTTDTDASWFPADTVKWKLFLDALIERYDGDGNSDMPGLLQPITRWHIEQEWPRVWCSQHADTALAKALEFATYERMTYNEIKLQQPNSEISFAGLTSHKMSAFYDGYDLSPTYCISNCINDTSGTQAQMALIPGFLQKRRNTIYLMQHASFDELDVHQYGDWFRIPGIIAWLKDSAFLGNRKVSFFEGGGPMCKACETIYHPVSDTDGVLPPNLVRDNASFVVYYFITGLANGVEHLNWNSTPEYHNWGSAWGDLDLLSKNYVGKPSIYTYRFLANTIFANTNADTVYRITESDPALFHYRIDPLMLDVVWSTQPLDSIVLSGSGTLYKWDIPVTCNSSYPTYCDSIVTETSVPVSGNYILSLHDGIPVFFSWNDVVSVAENGITNPSINVYPNPFSTQTTIETSADLIHVTLAIDNLLGQNLMVMEDVSGPNITLQRNQLPAGIYFLRILKNNRQIACKKIIVKD